jgi:hypothetical protein
MESIICYKYKREGKMKRILFLSICLVLMASTAYAFYVPDVTVNRPKVYVIDSSFVIDPTTGMSHADYVRDTILKQAPDADVHVLYASHGEQVSTADLVDKIYQAIREDADIINLSLGSPYYSASLAKAIQDAQDHGIVVVAASGNEGAGSPDYPAALPGVIAVGAIEQNPLTGKWDKAFYSNRGDVYAPGEINPKIRGTSFAAPYVTGQIAQAMIDNPNYTAQETANSVITKAYNNHGVVGPTLVSRGDRDNWSPPEQTLPDDRIFYDLLRLIAEVDALVREVFDIPGIIGFPFAEDNSDYFGSQESPFFRGSPYFGRREFLPIF